MLAAGTYDLVLTGKDIRGKGRPDVTVKEGICPITIKARSEAPKLTVGDENHDIASPADGRDSWYQITAPQTGIYVFEPVGRGGRSPSGAGGTDLFGNLSSGFRKQ